jgi:hypothetical protein
MWCIVEMSVDLDMNTSALENVIGPFPSEKEAIEYYFGNANLSKVYKGVGEINMINDTAVIVYEMDHPIT